MGEHPRRIHVNKEPLSTNIESLVTSTGQRDVAIQVSVKQENKGSQVGEHLAKGALSRIFSTKKSDDHTKKKDEDDPIIRALGQFGTWQLGVQLVLFFYNITYVFQLVIDSYESNLFGEFWCARPDHLKDIPVELWKKISGVYTQNEAGVTVYNPCLKKNIDYGQLNFNDSGTWNETGESLGCTSWEYEENESILSEWNLACISPSANSAAEMMFAVGGVLGSLINGYIMDRLGRRTYLIFGMSINGLISFLTALSPNYEVYLFFRAAQGFVVTGCYPALVILSMELSGKKWLGIIGSVFMFSFPLGYVMCAIVTYQFKDWRHLHYAASTFSIFLLSFFWIIPESPRWLWVKKNITQLTHVIEDALLINGGTELKQRTIHLLKTTGPMRYAAEDLTVKLSDLFETKTIRKLSIVSVPLFFLIFLAYYGTVLNLNGMYNPDSVYRYHIFSGIIEFTATAVCLSLVARPWMNDLLILFVSSISAGMLFLFVNALSNDSLGITCCLMGIRFFMSIINTNLLNYVAELYPTTMRGTGISFLNIFSFLALLVTGYGFSLDKIKKGLTIFLMGMSGIIGAFLFLLLPVLPNYSTIIDTIDQEENYLTEDSFISQI